MYYYFKATEEDYVVGCTRADGGFEIEGDYDTRQEAAARVNYLNGGVDPTLKAALEPLKGIADALANIASAQITRSMLLKKLDSGNGRSAKRR